MTASTPSIIPGCEMLLLEESLSDEERSRLQVLIGEGLAFRNDDGFIVLSEGCWAKVLRLDSWGDENF